MKRVLILTASFGDGHNAAARNVCEALEASGENVRAEVVDLLANSYGPLNTVARKTYNGLVTYAPYLWGGIYSLFDRPGLGQSRYLRFTRLQSGLARLLQETQPDCVVSTYPLYANAIQDLFGENARPFRLVTVITDSITVNAGWLQSPSDIYCVPNDQTAQILRRRGVEAERIRVPGFPVSLAFKDEPAQLADPERNGPWDLLYAVNTGQKKVGKAIRRLLELPQVRLTIAVGRHAKLKAKLINRLRDYGSRVQVFGWTNQMPRLMMSHHLLIAKAGGAMVQEAIAARCPMVVNQVIPGQEEGNAELITGCDIGFIAERTRDVLEAVQAAFRHDAKIWRRWRENLVRVSRPDASRQIARLVLSECEESGGRPELSTETPSRAAATPCNTPGAGANKVDVRPLLCDFHIHSSYSDGKLSVSELVDFYGRRGFDCICISDHLADPHRLIGKLARISRLTISPHQLEEYFSVIDSERRRAWRKYSMLVMAGIEFNKDGLTRKSSAHLLGIDLRQPIACDLDLVETIEAIHAQGGLAVASHPHIMKSEWGKNTLYLWENQDRFAPLLDAWEIANRNNMFNPVSARRLPYLANSDFHKPKHIYSWKTLVYAPKDPQAIKECVRRNDHVAITLYREGDSAFQGSGGNPVRPLPQATSDVSSARMGEAFPGNNLLLQEQTGG